MIIFGLSESKIHEIFHTEELHVKLSVTDQQLG